MCEYLYRSQLLLGTAVIMNNLADLADVVRSMFLCVLICSSISGDFTRTTTVDAGCCRIKNHHVLVNCVEPFFLLISLAGSYSRSRIAILNSWVEDEECARTTSFTLDGLKYP
uniref:Uncharacterized protein n=1 Tax=Schistocephalus solidus TaxID=70667 RepID=A0A0X3PYN6_SCHSO